MAEKDCKPSWEASEQLETDAALILGKMLFSFSRLDMAIGLLLVWKDGGRELEELTIKIANYSFHKKLALMEKLVEAKYAITSPAHSEYAEWMQDAHDKRTTRNKLVHGRWGPEVRKNKVANITGLPTSPHQKSTLYSISELEEMLDEIEGLRNRLYKLKKRWPV